MAAGGTSIITPWAGPWRRWQMLRYLAFPFVFLCSGLWPASAQELPRCDLRAGSAAAAAGADRVGPRERDGHLGRCLRCPLRDIVVTRRGPSVFRFSLSDGGSEKPVLTDPRLDGARFRCSIAAKELVWVFLERHRSVRMVVHKNARGGDVIEAVAGGSTGAAGRGTPIRETCRVHRHGD